MKDNTTTPFSYIYDSFLSKLTDDMYMELDELQTHRMLEELLGTVEPEYYYGEEDVKNLLEKGSLDELKDCLDFAPEGTVELVKKAAVETELNDIRKRNAIQEATGFNINSAIEINKETSEERPEETKVRRASAPKKEDAQVSTGRRVSAPTTSKYKIVNNK